MITQAQIHIDQLKKDIEELEFYKTQWLQAVEQMRDFQAGGKYSHILRLGDSTVHDGIEFLLHQYKIQQALK